MSNIQVNSDRIRAEIESVAITDNIRLSADENSVVIIDQVKLPNVLEYKKIDDLESGYQAIKKLEVRGAPAIGIFAGGVIYATEAGGMFGTHFHPLAAMNEINDNGLIAAVSSTAGVFIFLVELGINLALSTVIVRILDQIQKPSGSAA